jgi:diacylglycerol kinase (ATP)
MRHIFIINPVSGKKNAALHMRPASEQAAARLGVALPLAVTEAPGHATHLARQHSAGGDAVRLYAVGGDGTLNEVLAGAWPHPNAEVACVPCGSGNDFIRAFGHAGLFLDVPALLEGTAVPVDLIEVDGGICAAITSTGLDAEVAYHIPKYRRLPLMGGSMAYNLSIAERLLRPLGKQLRIEIDGRVIEDRLLIAAVCNAHHYGGGYHAAPMAKLDDGLLDVILVKKVSRLLIASIIGKYKNGRHWADGALTPSMASYMSHYRARQVLITPAGDEPFVLNVDGECGEARRLFAKVMPRAARFVLPHGTRLP